MSRTRTPHRGRYRPWIPKTKSTVLVLELGWHLHVGERLGERRSKRHAKRNAAQARRRESKRIVRDRGNETRPDSMT